ncbi:MAG: type IV pilus assembly protein PilM [bacterium]
MSFFFKFIPKKFLGVDIGTSAIKIVELQRRGDRKKLENYGEVKASVLYEKPFRTFEKSSLLLSSQDIARAIYAVIQEAKIKTKDCVFSIPDFSSFFTNFELPQMTKEELPQAVNYEARQHIPMPLGEVTLDWQVVGGNLPIEQKEKLKILLVAVPNEVINQYQEIAQICQLNLFGLEPEVFGLIRSLPPEDQKPAFCIIDIGAQSTTCSIIERKVLKMSYSFDTAGNQLTEQIAKSLSVGYSEAEEMRKKYGLLPGGEKSIKDVLLPLVDVILREIERISSGKNIQKFILAGGASLIPGLKEYFQERLGKETEISNPFADIFYPPILEKTLKDMGPSYAIAIGMALRGLE